MGNSSVYEKVAYFGQNFEHACNMEIGVGYLLTCIPLTDGDYH